ncbi:MAG: methyltransferase domain-containing protein [Chitinophagales bacterium]|nr:methyltransferase domain-containing protein [Chitinophagales bacterium]
MPTAVTDQQIIDYYEKSYDDYQIVWHVNSRMSMHYGYWDETTHSLKDALINMNRRLAAVAGIRSHHHVLDAGCGVGGSSVYLAKETGCRVTGITLSQVQVAKAKENAAKHSVSDQTDFRVVNFTATPFDDQSFDVVWCIESVCHANDKAAFLREAFRILKKGGTLIVADFFRTEKDPALDTHHWMDRWAKTWAIPAFEKLSGFESKAIQSGFSTVDNMDITKPIFPTAKRLYYCLIPGIICDRFLRLFGMRTNWNMGNVWSTLYQYRSLVEGFWDYRIVKAVK